MADKRFRTSWVTAFASGRFQGKGIVRNASAGGMFVATSALPEQGDAVELELVPVKGRRIPVSGIVWWTTAETLGRGRSEPGFGLRLLVESDDYQGLIDSLAR